MVIEIGTDLKVTKLRIRSDISDDFNEAEDYAMLVFWKYGGESSAVIGPKKIACRAGDIIFKKGNACAKTGEVNTKIYD